MAWPSDDLSCLDVTQAGGLIVDDVRFAATDPDEGASLSYDIDWAQTVAQ